MKKIILTAFIIMMLLLPTAAGAEQIYVSPGALPGGDGSPENPFGSIYDAQIYSRQINKNMSEDLYIYLRGGKYNLDEPIELSCDDSGTNGYRIIYKSYENERAVISGEKKITGWSLFDEGKNIYRAKTDNFYSRQFYVNGEKRTRAKTEENQKSDFGKLYLSCTDTGYRMKALNGTLKTLFSLKKPDDAEFVYRNTFRNPRMKIASVDRLSGTITMDSGFPMLTADDCKNIMWLENAYEFLDTPGEWYIDRDEGYIYYMPFENEDIVNSETVIPVLENLIKGDGVDFGYNKGVKSYVENIEFSDIDFSYTTWCGTEIPEGYPCSQGGFCGNYDTQNNPQFAINIDRGKNITIKNCVFNKLGGGAIRLGVGTKNAFINNNEVYNCSAGGIYIEERGRSWTDEKETYLAENNIISFNDVHDTGTEYNSSIGILAGYGKNFRIENNDVYNVPYTGISIGWGWNDAGDEAVFKTDIINHNNKIYRNNVHDCMQVLSDGGAIYNLGAQPGMDIRENVCYNIGASDGTAYYLDDGSRFVNLTDNIGYNAAFMVYAKGKYHNICDNYFKKGSRATFYPETGIDESCVIKNNKEITDGVYPENIIKASGRNPERKITIKGKTEPYEDICYGIFNKNGVEKSEDIFYINNVTADENGIYSVSVNVNNSLKNYTVNTSSKNTQINEEYENIRPEEFYRIYDTKTKQSENSGVMSENIVSAFSVRDSSYENVTVIAAVYDEENRLMKVQSEKVTGSKTDVICVDVTEYKKPYKVKVMMWDGYGECIPLTEFSVYNHILN